MSKKSNESLVASERFCYFPKIKLFYWPICWSTVIRIHSLDESTTVSQAQHLDTVSIRRVERLKRHARSLWRAIISILNTKRGSYSAVFIANQLSSADYNPPVFVNWRKSKQQQLTNLERGVERTQTVSALTAEGEKH